MYIKKPPNRLFDFEFGGPGIHLENIFTLFPQNIGLFGKNRFNEYSFVGDHPTASWASPP
jgi:hypothetical protein